MLTPVRVAVVMGTRPEAIKLAPVVRALRAHQGFDTVVVSTGQHREMLAQALALFALAPDIDLDIMSPGQTLHGITCRTVAGMHKVLDERAPDWVLVQGDTTTAFAAALAAFYQRIPVGHVEAGLRSGQRYSPFPEEINRRIADQLSDVLFAPTERARNLLLREGFPSSRIHVTGNTVVDALLTARQLARTQDQGLEQLLGADLRMHKLILVTAHRRESFGAALENMCRALRRIVDEHPDTCIVYPVHLNPSVDGPVRRMLGDHPRIRLLEPLGYLQFVVLLDRAYLILTDSGGIQEEAPTFAKPLLVMRDVTERPEGVEAGVAQLVGTSEESIVAAARALLRDPEQYRAMASGLNPYGDGRAAARIVSILDVESHRLGEREPIASGSAVGIEGGNYAF